MWSTGEQKQSAMLKVKPPDGYPPEEGRYVRGNDYSPVAGCVILDTFDFAIPSQPDEPVIASAHLSAGFRNKGSEHA